MLDIAPPRTYKANDSRFEAPFVAASGTMDYDALAYAMNQRPIYLVENGRVVAQIGAKNNIAAQNGYMRSYALAYGK